MVRLKGKRFLITQNSLCALAGSEIVVLELADYLKSQGAEVVVFTYFFSNPIKVFFDEKKIKVIDNQDAELSLSDFDYIWVHHQVLPKSIIVDLGEKLPKKIPIFIFNHMSPHDYVPLERPYIWDMELRLASKALFNSIETKNVLVPEILSSEVNDIDILPNPAPIAFSKIKSKSMVGGGSPRRILVVSNHPPPEVEELKQKFSEYGIKVISAGEKHGTRLIEADYLSTFDVVLTIGKTVQYALCAGIPVYVYDQFGGNGYLNDENIKLSSKNNFSGREFGKKSSKEIADDILNNYEDAKKFQLSNRDKFINKYSINNILPKIFSSIKNKNIKPFDKVYINYLLTETGLIQQYIASIHSLSIGFSAEREKSRLLSEDVRVLSDRIRQIETDISNFRNQKMIRAADKINTMLKRLLK
jgi:hypothetical protein